MSLRGLQLKLEENSLQRVAPALVRVKLANVTNDLFSLNPAELTHDAAGC